MLYPDNKDNDNVASHITESNDNDDDNDKHTRRKQVHERNWYKNAYQNIHNVNISPEGTTTNATTHIIKK